MKLTSFHRNRAAISHVWEEKVTFLSSSSACSTPTGCLKWVYYSGEENVRSQCHYIPKHHRPSVALTYFSRDKKKNFDHYVWDTLYGLRWQDKLTSAKLLSRAVAWEGWGKWGGWVGNSLGSTWSFVTTVYNSRWVGAKRVMTLVNTVSLYLISWWQSQTRQEKKNTSLKTGKGQRKQGRFKAQEAWDNFKEILLLYRIHEGLNKGRLLSGFRGIWAHTLDTLHNWTTVGNKL